MAIFFAVLVVSLVTTVNDYKKERQFEKLVEAADAEKTVHCVREGLEHEEVTIDNKTVKRLKRTHIDDLVVGDIVQIENGKTIPADAILLTGESVEIDESAATGESQKMKKMSYMECVAEYEKLKSRDPEAAKKPTSVPSPILLSGTKVSRGSGVYMVIVVGDLSFMGKLRSDMDEEKEDTPLQKKLTTVAKHIGTIGLFAAIATVLVMLVSYFISRIRDGGWGWSDIGLCFSYIVLGITVLVVAIPEGLPLAVTIAMAYSVMKMFKENNFVKSLMACETMGEVNNICTDKTGTLTQNKMTALELWINKTPYNLENRDVKEDKVGDFKKAVPEADREAIFEVLACNCNVKDANPTEEGFLNLLKACKYDVHDPREKLMHIPKPKEGEDETAKDEKKEEAVTAPLIDGRKAYKQLTFTSTRKRSATLLKKGDQDMLFTFGNVIKILECCTHIYINGQEVPLTPEIDGSLRECIKKANGRTLRTLGIARKKLAPGEGWDYGLETNKDDVHEVEQKGLTFIGYIGLRDTLRPGVKEAVDILTHRSGITVRMVTGDNFDTAVAIAKECGILNPDSPEVLDKDVAMAGIDFYERVGGKTLVCRACTEGKTPPEPSKEKPLEERKDEEKSAVKPNELAIEMKEAPKKSSDEDDKICSKCGSKLEVAPGNLPEFKKIVEKLRVISSCRPGDKYLLVAGLKYLGNVVGVTGDGSNDAPALKKADIGLAMNAGTDLAKDSAGIVLLDDNFASIKTAVNWGRNIFDSIKKFLQFQLCVNIVALTLAFVGSAIISQSPLSAVQLLWVNLIMDSLASLALATDSPTPDQLERPPVKKDDYIVTKVCIVFLYNQK